MFQLYLMLNCQSGPRGSQGVTPVTHLILPLWFNYGIPSSSRPQRRHPRRLQVLQDRHVNPTVVRHVMKKLGLVRKSQSRTRIIKCQIERFTALAISCTWYLVKMRKCTSSNCFNNTNHCCTRKSLGPSCSLHLFFPENGKMSEFESLHHGNAESN